MFARLFPTRRTPTASAPALSSPGLERLADRDLRDIGVDRRLLRDRLAHAPFEVPNDRV